jgi:hypothetical protein
LNWSTEASTGAMAVKGRFDAACSAAREGAARDVAEVGVVGDVGDGLRARVVALEVARDGAALATGVGIA